MILIKGYAGAKKVCEVSFDLPEKIDQVEIVHNGVKTVSEATAT